MEGEREGEEERTGGEKEGRQKLGGKGGREREADTDRERGREGR